MNSDHVQRYHVRQDGFIYSVRDGEWVKVKSVKCFLKNLTRYEDDDNPTCYGLQPYDKGEWVKFEDIEQLFRED